MTTYNFAQEDIDQAKEFLKGLLASNPDTQDVDTSEGSALTDLVVRSWALFYAFFKNTIQDVGFRQSLLRVDNLPEEERSEAIQELLSNFFLTLKTGDKSQGQARIIATQPFSFIFNPPESFVFVRQDQRFIPVEATVINPDVAGTFSVIQNENGEIEYVYEINLIAVEAGAEGDIDPGIFESFTEIDPAVKRVENLRKFAGGKGDETVDEFKNRGPDAVAVRDLVTEPAIKTVLLDEFSQLKFVDTIGAGDQEMQRDLRDMSLTPGVTQPIHILGHIDIYGAFELLPNLSLSSPVSVHQTSRGPVVGVRMPDVPIFQIRRVIDNTLGRDLVSGEFSRVVIDLNFNSSAEQEFYLKVPANFIGDDLTIIYDSALGFDPVAAFVRSREQRNLCNNSLMKSKYPIYIILDIEYELPATLPDIDEGIFKNEMITFTKLLDPSLPISVSTYTNAIKEAFPDITAIRQPLNVVGDFYLPDGEIFRGFAVDKFGAPDRFDIGYSQRTVVYYLIEENITITRSVSAS